MPATNQIQKRKKHPGLYIAFEGIDCTGKSTQIQRLKRWLELEGYLSFVTHEPGDSECALSEKIRNLLLDPENKIDPRTEALLFAASRAQAIPESIAPHLKNGEVVLSDRSVYSSLAYQGKGRKLASDYLYSQVVMGNSGHAALIHDPLLVFNHWAIHGLYPDLTFYLRLPYEEMIKRKEQRGIPTDRIEAEQRDFYEKTISGFDGLARSLSNFVIIDASKTEIEVFQDIVNVLRQVIGGFILTSTITPAPQPKLEKKVYRTALDYAKMGPAGAHLELADDGEVPEEETTVDVDALDVDLNF